MTAVTIPILVQNPQLRTLNILRDLPAVADLVETCFADTMDAEGRRYVQQMRSAGKDNQFLRWANSAVDTVSMPLSGYVWEEKGEIIGNVSLIPYRHARKKYYLIANVAVRPDQRRRGIGRALTLAGMQHARAHRADEIWLHVRSDNPGAIALYEELGFRERLRRTAWHAKTGQNSPSAEAGIQISPRYNRDWALQEGWLRRLYPDLMDWYQSMPWRSLRPGLGPAIYRFFVDVDTRHWSAYSGGRLMGALTWQPASGAADRLWAAVPPEGGEGALTALLAHALRSLSWRQALSMDFPAEVYPAAVEAAGFRPYRTLLWMRAEDEIRSTRPGNPPGTAA
jgi:ribosomal protein S18 acetylase RimI-like enzyme